MVRTHIQEVAIADLVQDWQLYPRTQVSSVTVAQLADALESGVHLPPIRVEAGNMRVIDGYHRIAAHKKLGRQTIPAQLEKVADDKNFFELAVAANSAHGTRYTPYDQARVLARALELGLAKERIALALHVPATRIEQIEGNFSRIGTMAAPTKRSIQKYVSGRQLTPAEATANNKLSGMPMLFHVNQVIIFLENDFVDWDDPSVLARLHVLQNAIAERITVDARELAFAG